MVERGSKSFLSGVQSDVEMEKQIEEREQNPSTRLYAFVTAYIAKSRCRSRDQKELEELRKEMLALEKNVEEGEVDGEQPHILRISRREFPGKLSGEPRKDRTVFFSDGTSMRFQELESRNLDTSKFLNWVEAQLKYYSRIKDPTPEVENTLAVFRSVQRQTELLSATTVNTRCTPDSPELRKQRISARKRR